MGVSAFVYWQALDGGGWGLIQSNPGDKWIGAANPKYFALAQYSRHIRPGMKILANSDKKKIAAHDTRRQALVLVTVNMEESSQTILFDLSKFAAAAGPIATWTTETGDSGARYRAGKDSALDGTTVRASVPPKSVQTIEVYGVKQ